MIAETSQLIGSEWFGLYKESWGNDLVPAAFSHPAKVQPALSKKIIEHLLEQGYIEPGSVVVDPFAGIGGFALACMMNGLHYIGNELEPRFVDLAWQNIELWNGRYSAHFPGWGSARILLGDSRFLSAVLEGAGCVVSSPPFVNQFPAHDKPENYKGFEHVGSVKHTAGYAYADNSPGQLGGMKEGTPPAAIISSPAYGDSVSGNGEGPGARFDSVFHKGDNATKKSSSNGYGVTEGNLGNLAVGAMVGLPPFENSLTADGRGAADMKIARDMAKKHKRIYTDRSFNPHDYGQTPGNIGNDTGNTFWQAAAVILSQCYQVLRPGGVAVFVTGDFVRGKKRVYFGRQWLALCESVGFEPVEWIVAHKHEPGPVQTGIFEDKDTSKERVSFFRKLSNKKAIESGNGGAVILNEDVLIVQKPLFVRPEVTIP